MTYYVTGSNSLNDKAKLSKNLREFDQKNMFQFYNSSFANPLQFEIYFNESSLTQSEEQFLARNNSGVWILKPALTAQGQGIQIIHDIKELEQAVQDKSQNKEQKNDKFSNYKYFILQKYVEKPLLVDKKKLDFRIYMAIVQADPLIVMIYPSYTKITLVDYDVNSSDLRVHLGNGDYQKQGLSNYDEIIRKNNYHFDIRLFKEKMMEFFPTMTEKDFNKIIQKCKVAITYGILAVKDQLVKRKGDSQIMGVDFCIDENFNPWLLEYNTQPYIVASHAILEQILPDFIYDWMDSIIQINKLSTQEVIEQSMKDYQFPCKFLRRNLCNLIINDAVGYNYLQSVDLENLYN